MPKFRTRPCTVEAVQWTGSNLEELQRFVGSAKIYHNDTPDFQIISIENEDGLVTVGPGDWVMLLAGLELVTCKNSDFEEKYEAAAE